MLPPAVYECLTRSNVTNIEFSLIFANVIDYKWNHIAVLIFISLIVSRLDLFKTSLFAIYSSYVNFLCLSLDCVFPISAFIFLLLLRVIQILRKP